MTGRIKWFDARKHYGWIVPDHGGPNVFFHEDAAKGLTAAELKHYAPVVYQARNTSRKPQASKVELRDERRSYSAAAD